MGIFPKTLQWNLQSESSMWTFSKPTKRTISWKLVRWPRKLYFASLGITWCFCREIFVILKIKDTVTIFKFLWISELFLNQRFRRDKAQNVNSLSLASNHWVWIWLFWSQTGWVIPMTSSIRASKVPYKFTKNPGS